MILQFTQSRNRGNPEPTMPGRRGKNFLIKANPRTSVALLMTERREMGTRIQEALDGQAGARRWMCVIRGTPTRAAALKISPRVLLVDVGSPKAPDVFAQSIRRYGNAPCVLVTEAGGEDAAAELLLAGARACVHAAHLGGLPQVLEAVEHGASPVPPEVRARLVDHLNQIVRQRLLPEIQPLRWSEQRLRRTRRIDSFPRRVAEAE